MKRLVCLVLSLLLLATTIASAETSFDVSNYSLTELMELRAIIDDQINTLSAIPSEELQPGKYIAGQDIAAGSYIIHGLMDKEPSGYTPQVLIADSLDQVSCSEYRCYEYMKTGEKWYVNLTTGNVVEVRSGSVTIEPAPTLICSPNSADDDIPSTATMVPGFYTAGTDIVAGSYIMQGLMDKGPDGYTPQVLIANSMEDAQYSEYREYEYMKKGSTWRIQLEAGNVIEIRAGDVCIQEVVPLAFAPSEEERQSVAAQAEIETQPSADNGDKFSVVKGVYTAGRDIKAGSYTLTLTDCKQSTVVATFDNADNLAAYTSWDSSNNLKAYGKTAVYAKKDVPVHIYLEDGDKLYIGDGQGYLTESAPSTVMKGVYIVGTDVQPGAHVITLSDIHGSAIVATFSSMENLLSYVTWDSSNNLKEYGKTAVYAKSDVPVHIYLEEGDFLFIAEGSGTIVNAQEDVLTKGVYPIGKDLKPGSYLITLNDFHNYATVATFANCSDLVSYISWDSANNLKEYSTTSVSVKKGEQFHITLVEGECLFISDGTGSFTIQ